MSGRYLNMAIFAWGFEINCEGKGQIGAGGAAKWGRCGGNDGYLEGGAGMEHL